MSPAPEVTGRYRLTGEVGEPVGEWQPVKIESVNYETGVVMIFAPALEVKAEQRIELVFDYGLVRYELPLTVLPPPVTLIRFSSWRRARP